MVELQSSVTKSGTIRSRLPREHLTEAEIERLMTVARQDGRYGHRDATAIMVAFRHGLRSSELVDLQWDQIDFVQKMIRINRVKNGTGSMHYPGNSELRALRRLQRESAAGPHVFVSERGGPITTAWFRKMMARLGERAKMPFLIHPHMLRHSCGFKYANEGRHQIGFAAGQGNRGYDTKEAQRTHARRNLAERMPELVAELVRLKVDVLVVSNSPAALAAKNATRTIPIVMVAGDPVGSALWPA